MLDDDDLMKRPTTISCRLLANAAAGKVPGTFLRLALDHGGKFGHKSVSGSRTVRTLGAPAGVALRSHFQSRRSLLVWKIFGQRLDGFSNDDFAHETVPGDPISLRYQGQAAPADTPAGNNRLINLAYTGSIMPPPEAVAGTYRGSGRRKIKVAPLSDEDRRTLVRWIDLGCPIDLDFDPANAASAATAGCRTTTGRR